MVLLGRDSATLADVADTIKARSGPEPRVLSCDLAMPDDIASACASILDENPVVDVLINNAAPWLTGRLDEIADDDIVSTVAAAVSGTILLTKGLLPGLHRSDAADIVTIVSTSGVPGWDLSGGSVPFYAAKHGQSGFSDKLRHELEGTKIRVSAIYPPNFEDADPTKADWERPSGQDGSLSNREIVSTVLFILDAPRTCSFPLVIIDGSSQSST